MEKIIVLTKSFATIYFFLVFCGILFWALRKKNREKLENHREIPFLEE